MNDRVEEEIIEKERRSSSRLEPISDRGLFPWVKAKGSTNYHLYWMPLANPSPFAQRRWALRFYERFRQAITGKTETLAHLFLQMKVLYPDLSDPFIRTSTRFAPMLGLSRRRGAALPALPDADYIDRLQKGKLVYDHKALQPDYCYWFLKDEIQEQVNLFFGYGGLMTIFAKAQESAQPKPPELPPSITKHPQFAPMLADDAVGKMMRSLQRMSSPMFPQSKAIFGRGMEEDLQFAGLKFIMPLFCAQDFFDAKPAEIEEWFSMFDVVLTESPQDKGLLLASREDLPLEAILTEILLAMDEAGDRYPEFA